MIAVRYASILRFLPIVDSVPVDLPWANSGNVNEALKMGNPAPPHPPEIDGKVLLPGDAGYDHARAAWKAINARRPAQAAQARSGDGVDITPAFALRHDYRVSIP